MNISLSRTWPRTGKLSPAIAEAEGHSILQATDGVEALAVLKHEKVDQFGYRNHNVTSGCRLGIHFRHSNAEHGWLWSLHKAAKLGVCRGNLKK